MNAMFAAFQTHPLAIGSDDETNHQILDGMVNAVSSAASYESLYNEKFRTTLNFTITFGHSRFKSTEASRVTHAWVAFGENCFCGWHGDFLFNITRHICK